VADRGRIEHVDGDLFELDPATLIMMRGQVEQHLEYPTYSQHIQPMHKRAHDKRHWEMVQAIEVLKESMAWWAGYQEARGLTPQQCHRAFYYRFGIDVLSAQMLDKNDAEALHHKVQEHIAKISR
jgi:hypothetical protein